jgi:hypothetical protein
MRWLSCGEGEWEEGGKFEKITFFAKQKKSKKAKKNKKV